MPDMFQLFLIICISLLTLSFVILFIRPSLVWWKIFNKVIADLKSLKGSKGNHNIPDRISVEVMTSEPLKHLWSEYCETLHNQTDFDDGEEVITQIRATVPAEIFFSTQVLVDTPLRTEFFKHLPGIFTGIGIIGTFNGLISGLHAFHFSDDPSKQKIVLTSLLTSVSNAFIFSASAIALAMVIILFEKIAVTRRYKQVEEICQIIDSFFDAGAGEEYLASIVKSSAHTATSTAQLKDGLLTELKELLTNLTERHIQAAQENNKALGEAITVGISGPIKDLKETLSGLDDRNDKAVESMLSNIIHAFMTKLEETFGGQMTGLNTMMLETTNSMKSMQENFAQMLTLMSDAGKNAGEAMGDQLKEAMLMAELRQKEMNASMVEFITALKDTVATSQTETNEQMKVMLNDIQENMQGLVTSLSNEQNKVSEKSTEVQERMGEHAKSFVNGINDQMNELIKQSAETALAMKQNIENLQKISTDSIDKMNAGADTLHLASTQFAKAGDGVSNVLTLTADLSSKLMSAGQNLEVTSKTIQSVVAEFQRTRESMTNMTEALNSIIQRAQAESGMTDDLLQKMKLITASFNTSRVDTEEYMTQISNVMETSFESFSNSMVKALEKSRTEFDKSLSGAVGMLRSVIEDLAANSDKG